MAVRALTPSLPADRPPARATPAAPGDTRDRILDAAARLFATADSRGASLRAIAREAAVNPALVHYHFGTREQLLEAVILRALEPIQARRRQRVEELRARMETLSPRDLASLFVAPLLRDPSAPGPKETTDLRLLTRVFAEERSLAEELTLRHFAEGMQALGALLSDALPWIPTPVRERRIRFCVQSALETLSGTAADPAAKTAAACEGATAPRASLTSDLIDFLAGGLTAPVSDPAPDPDLAKEPA